MNLERDREVISAESCSFDAPDSFKERRRSPMLRGATAGRIGTMAGGQKVAHMFHVCWSKLF